MTQWCVLIEFRFKCNLKTVRQIRGNAVDLIYL